jgi:hypothetical protein
MFHYFQLYLCHLYGFHFIKNLLLRHIHIIVGLHWRLLTCIAGCVFAYVLSWINTIHSLFVFVFIYFLNVFIFLCFFFDLNIFVFLFKYIYILLIYVYILYVHVYFLFKLIYIYIIKTYIYIVIVICNHCMIVYFW